MLGSDVSALLLQLGLCSQWLRLRLLALQARINGRDLPRQANSPGNGEWFRSGWFRSGQYSPKRGSMQRTGAARDEKNSGLQRWVLLAQESAAGFESKELVAATPCHVPASSTVPVRGSLLLLEERRQLRLRVVHLRRQWLLLSALLRQLPLHVSKLLLHTLLVRRHLLLGLGWQRARRVSKGRSR